MLIFKYLKANFTNKNFILNEGGKHLRDFTYIDDVIKILTKMKNVKFMKKFSIVNICSNKPIKVISVINKINKFNKNFSYISRSSNLLRKIEVKVTHGNNMKVKKFFKKFRFTSFDKALRKTITWYIDKKIYKIT
jgi:dTDP-D-glucose 4,6-dehydratase